MEVSSSLSPLLLIFFLSSLLLQTHAIPTKKSYIVYLRSHSYGPKPSLFDAQLISESHYDLLGLVLGSKSIAKESIFYSYNRFINGFAAMLDEEHATEIAKSPNVVSVFESQIRKLHTTHSWNFLGLENNQGVPPNSLWNAARFGEDTIIGNLDTGVWPESKSFNDDGYGPIPSRWRGACAGGPNFPCNRKLIGARYFNKGFEAHRGGSLNASYNNARDHDGHGTHTLSTAGGSLVPGANLFGIANGTAKGGSPKARVATYKVCWPTDDDGGCFDADVIAGFEAAISDGVDVLSISLGGPSLEFYKDVMAVGSFYAVQQGIVVVSSAGNEGPSPGTVSNVAPWMFTIGASAIDRSFDNYVTLGNKLQLKGTSLNGQGTPGGKFYPLISSVSAKAADASDNFALLCGRGSLDPSKVKGKIVVCLRGNNPRISKSYEAFKAGAVGMILANDKTSGNDILADVHFLPATDVNYTNGLSIYQYLNSTKNPVALITSVTTVLGVKPAPYMADFSSRGPNPIDESILKPDVTAPGVHILASFSEAVPPTTAPDDMRRTSFMVDSGTSMSCPHVSGIVGLLKTLYPNWSPAAIKSAIMTTGTFADRDAKTRGNDGGRIKDIGDIGASPLAYGSGHVNPNNAMHPGLIYDLTTDDYLNLLCARGYNASQIMIFVYKPFTCAKTFKATDFNYPSISVPDLKPGVTLRINRRVKNVGGPGTYVARVKAPVGVSVSIEPSSLQFSNVGEEKAFTVVLKRTGIGKQGSYVFGTLVWFDGKHNVRSPIAVKL